MSRTYTDYISKTAITLPETYIDVKTGESYSISAKVQEQIEYHTTNNTLIHLVLSALDQYLHPRMVKGGSEEILYELLEIKKMMLNGHSTTNLSSFVRISNQQKTMDLEMQELEEVLEAFGG